MDESLAHEKNVESFGVLDALVGTQATEQPTESASNFGVLDALVGTQASESSTEQTTFGVLDALVSTQATEHPTESASNFGVLDALVSTQDSGAATEQPTGSVSNQHALESSTRPTFVFDVETRKHGRHVVLVDSILKDLLSDNMLPGTYTPPHQVRIQNALTSKDNVHKCTVVIYYTASEPMFLVHVDFLYLVPKGRYVSDSTLCASMSFSPAIFQTVLTELSGMNLGQEKLLTSTTQYLDIIFDVLKRLPTSTFAALFWVLVATPTVPSTGLDEQVVSTMQETIRTMLRDLVALRSGDDWTAFKGPRHHKWVSSAFRPDVATKCWDDLVRVFDTLGDTK